MLVFSFCSGCTLNVSFRQCVTSTRLFGSAPWVRPLWTSRGPIRHPVWIPGVLVVWAHPDRACTEEMVLKWTTALTVCWWKPSQIRMGKSIKRGFKHKCLSSMIEIRCVCLLKGIVHPKIEMWCLSAYSQGIQDVGDFVSSVEHKRRFLTQTVAVCQSYNGSQWDPRLWE